MNQTRYPTASLALRLSLAFLFLAAPVLGAGECYYPDKSRHSEGIPCDPNASGPVTCCERTHTCLSNGFCWDTSNNQILRESCTDKGFGGSCALYCYAGGQRNKNGYLKQCFLPDQPTEMSLWACNRNATDCRSNFTMEPGYIDDRRPAAESKILYAIPEDGPNSADDSLKAGLGAGLGIGIPLLLGLLTALFFLRKAKQELARARSMPYIKGSEAFTSDGSTVALAVPNNNLTTYNTTPDLTLPTSSHQQQQGWYYVPPVASPVPSQQPSPTQHYAAPQSQELRQSTSYQALSSQPSEGDFQPAAGEAPPTAGGFHYQTQELEGNGHLHEAANSNIPISPNYDPQTKYPPMFFR